MSEINKPTTQPSLAKKKKSVATVFIGIVILLALIVLGAQIIFVLIPDLSHGAAQQKEYKNYQMQTR